MAMPKRNFVITLGIILLFLVCGAISIIPQNKEIQPLIIGKRFTPIIQKPVLNTISNEGWLVTSEYAGRDIEFGKRYFLSGKAYKIPEMGIEETQDPWNYINGDWFSWESADGQTYSVRMTNGYTTAFKVNNSFKNVDLMYTPTFGLGIKRILELFIFNEILANGVMPFVDETSKQIKYFTEETNPSDYYLSKGKTILSLRNDPSTLSPFENKPTTLTEQVVKSELVFYGTNIGETAPLFDMVMLDGRKVNLNEFYGRKTVLNIWATWCGVCITEFPLINEAYVNNKDVNILAVCSDGTPKQIQRIKDKYSTRYPCDFTMSSAPGIDKVYGLKGFPTTYFLNETGVIKYIKIGGFASTSEIQEMLK